MKSCLVTLKIGLSSLRVLKIAGIISFELNSASSNTRSPTMRCGLWRFWRCALRGNINMNNLIMHCLLCFFNNSPMITPVKIMSHYKVRHQDQFLVFCRLLTSTFPDFRGCRKWRYPINPKPAGNSFKESLLSSVTPLMHHVKYGQPFSKRGTIRVPSAGWLCYCQPGSNLLL